MENIKQNLQSGDNALIEKTLETLVLVFTPGQEMEGTDLPSLPNPITCGMLPLFIPLLEGSLRRHTIICISQLSDGEAVSEELIKNNIPKIFIDLLEKDPEVRDAVVMALLNFVGVSKDVRSELIKCKMVEIIAKLIPEMKGETLVTSIMTISQLFPEQVPTYFEPMIPLCPELLTKGAPIIKTTLLWTMYALSRNLLGSLMLIEHHIIRYIVPLLEHDAKYVLPALRVLSNLLNVLGEDDIDKRDLVPYVLALSPEATNPESKLSVADKENEFQEPLVRIYLGIIAPIVKAFFYPWSSPDVKCEVIFTLSNAAVYSLNIVQAIVTINPFPAFHPLLQECNEQLFTDFAYLYSNVAICTTEEQLSPILDMNFIGALCLFLKRPGKHLENVLTGIYNALAVAVGNDMDIPPWVFAAVDELADNSDEEVASTANSILYEYDSDADSE